MTCFTSLDQQRRQLPHSLPLLRCRTVSAWVHNRGPVGPGLTRLCVYSSRCLILLLSCLGMSPAAGTSSPEWAASAWSLVCYYKLQKFFLRWTTLWISPESCHLKCFFFLTSVVIASTHCGWVRGRQPAGHCILSFFKSIAAAVECIAAWTRCAFNLGQDLARLAGRSLVCYRSPQASCLVRSVLLLFFSASFFNIKILYYKNMANLWRLRLEACGLEPVPCSLRLGALNLLAVDHDPWTMLLPAVGHDLQLQGYGLQLLGRSAWLTSIVNCFIVRSSHIFLSIYILKEVFIFFWVHVHKNHLVLFKTFRFCIFKCFVTISLIYIYKDIFLSYFLSYFFNCVCFKALEAWSFYYYIYVFLSIQDYFWSWHSSYSVRLEAWSLEPDFWRPGGGFQLQVV